MDGEMLIALIKIIIILPLVTALAYFLIKYGLARQTFSAAGRRRMRLVEQLSISPKSAISLVQVGDDYILLAHSESGVHVIREMDGLPETIVIQDFEKINIKGIYENLKLAAGENHLLGKLWPGKGKNK